MMTAIIISAGDRMLLSGSYNRGLRVMVSLAVEDDALELLLSLLAAAAGHVEAELRRRRAASVKADRLERHAVADREQPPGVVTLGDPSPSPSAGAGLIEEGGAA